MANELNRQESPEKGWKSIELGDRYNIFISFFSLIVSIAGFYLLYRTLQSGNETDNKNTYLQTYAWTIDVDKNLSEHSDIIPYLRRDSTSDLTNPDKEAQAEAYAEFRLDAYDAVLNNKSYFKTDTSTKQDWIRTVRIEFIKYPLLKEVYERDINLYSCPLNVAYYKAFKTNLLPRCANEACP